VTTTKITSPIGKKKMPIPKNEIERPREIPSAVWDRAVAMVRELASSADYFWPVWARVFRRHLSRVSGGADAAVFYSLFTVYQQAGGAGSTYEPIPAAGVAVDGSAAAGASSESSNDGGA